VTKEMITNDVFDIAKRIKEIDPDYFVVYDKKLCRFEVHNKRQRYDTLALVLPYDRLDCRAIEKVASTRIEYIADQLDKIDLHNFRQEEREKKVTLQNRLDECQELFRHLSR